MRQLYSVRKDRLGMTLRPAKRASPSSKTELMTWLWRALPKSFSAKSDRTAQALESSSSRGSHSEPGSCPDRPRPDTAGTRTNRRTWCGGAVATDQAGERHRRRPQWDEGDRVAPRPVVAAA